MGATDSVMGAPEGLLSVFFITGFFLGTCLNEETCVGDARFNEGVLQLKIDRARTDTVSGLKYKERSKDLVAMVDVIGVCLPGVNPSVLADSFSSCKNEKMEEVCTVAKRGGLEDKEELHPAMKAKVPKKRKKKPRKREKMPGRKRRRRGSKGGEIGRVDSAK